MLRANVRKPMTRHPAILFICLLLILSGASFAAEDNAGEKKEKQHIRLDKDKKTIEIDGRICLDEGPLELFACAEGGKEYESLVSIKGDPWQLHLSLLLLGLKPGGGPEYQGDPTKPFGDTLTIEVQWEQDGKTVRKRAEDLIYDAKRKDTMPHVEWVFVGSKFEKNEEGKNYYVANRDRSIVTVFHDPYTVIDNPLEAGADDTVYLVNKKAIPPKETPVVLIIRPTIKETDDTPENAR